MSSALLSLQFAQDAASRHWYMSIAIRGYYIVYRAVIYRTKPCYEHTHRRPEGFCLFFSSEFWRPLS